MTTGRLERIPLRVLLVSTMLLLVLAGLVVSGVSVALTMRAQLVDRVDGQLLDAADTWAHRPPARPGEGPGSDFPPDRPSREAPPSRFYVEQRAPSGSIVLSVDESDDRPEVPASPHTGTPITVPGTNGNWRVLVLPSAQGTTVVGLPMDSEVDQTITLLIVLSTALGGVVLLGVAAAGWVLVTRALRPLDEMRSVAGHIADGDLKRRLPPRPPGTEVGDLTASFNEMIDALQNALAASSASEAQARASAERTRRFAADASHELRTPLTSIRGFAELHRMGALPDASTALEKIEDESLRMSRIVDDLLTLAHLDAQRPLERAPVDVADLAITAVDAARATAPHRTIELSIEAVPVVNADHGRLHQVMTNLLANALRHTPDDARVWVVVRLDNDDAMITISDNGPGMTKQDATQAFERFHRADPSRTRSAGAGSGLGLSIVAELVRAHGGTVILDTAPGKGATFVVRLPAN